MRRPEADAQQGRQGKALPDAPVTVVIVHWNQPERCVRTGRAFMGQEGVDAHLIVVDNGSAPAAASEVAAGLPAAELVRVGRNAGFGAAANVGVRRWLDGGAGEWVVVAPHDALPEPHCLRRLLDAVAERPRAGLASAEFGEPGKPVIDRYFGGILVDRQLDEGWEDAGHPHGTLLLARRGCLDDIGLFDERYFAYCEEADLGLRASAAGWEVGVVWGAIVRNPSVSVRSEVAEYLMLRNSLLLVREHFGRYPVFIRICFALVNTARLGLHPAARGPFFSWPARRRAVRDFLLRRLGPPPPELAMAAGQGISSRIR
jgi:N-acetylglucosaminyl-diphospho-decaprenol L-rhamnosyltransferase